MDKETLSNYGWIVICILVLSVMIALATPFGNYIAKAVENTTEGLFSTSQNAMNTAFGDLDVQIDDQTFEKGYTGGQPDNETITGFTKLTAKTWNGLNDFYASYIWTDGTNTYYSCGSNAQYVLNGNTWEVKTWTNLRNFTGDQVWTDGTKIHYSYNASHHIFANGEWHYYGWRNSSSSSSSNVGSIYGRFMWTDGTDYYHSYEGKHYKVVGNNSITEIRYKWTTPYNFTGSYVWTDGVNIYYSDGTKQYILSDGNWKSHTWEGLSDFDKENVWTDGTNIYYSAGTVQYVLNGNTWIPKTWDGLDSFSGRCVWTDGVNYYYSSGTTHYVFS